jgi:hypothetical protein
MKNMKKNGINNCPKAGQLPPIHTPQERQFRPTHTLTHSHALTHTHTRTPQEVFDEVIMMKIKTEKEIERVTHSRTPTPTHTPQ